MLHMHLLNLCVFLSFHTQHAIQISYTAFFIIIFHHIAFSSPQSKSFFIILLVFIWDIIFHYKTCFHYLIFYTTSVPLQNLFP
jgi:hypothetical protein